MEKYSTAPTPAAMKFLAGNCISFAYARGVQTNKFRLFFSTFPADVKIMEEDLHLVVKSEVDGWDFTGWNSIK